MTTTKQSSLSSKQYFDEHKESTRSELKKISFKEDLSDKQKKALTDLLLDDVKEKQNTEEFKKYAEVRKADYKKIRELVIERVGDPKAVTKEDIQETVDFFYGNSETKESKEKLPEIAQSKKRDSMLSYAQKNDTEHAERIEGRLGTINELRAKGIINDSSEGVNVKGLCSFASRESHNKVLEENFGKNVETPYDWKTHAGNISKLNTVSKYYLDKKMKQGLKGNYKLGSKEFIDNTIFPWIEQNFEGVRNQYDKLYILQLINPDLFTRLWLDSVDSTGFSRQRVKLLRNVNSRGFHEVGNDYIIGGLFLVGNA